MEVAEISSIVAGRHRDPFSLLCPHGNEIRAWLPNAADAWVVTSTGAIARIGITVPAGAVTVVMLLP